MFHFYRVLLIIVIVSSVFGQLKKGNNAGNCDLSNVSPNEWSTAIPLVIFDNSTGTIASYEDKSSSVKTVTFKNDGICEGCLDISLVSEMLKLDILDSFGHFEETLPTVFALKPSALLQCESQSELDFIIQLKDTNNHDPEFLPGIPQSINLPMPIFEGINIGILNPELNISVKDIDFYNRGIDFKILPDEYFEVSTIDNGATYQNRKVYTAVLKTKKKMNLKEDYKITITAFDKPDDTTELSRHVSTDVLIKVDKENSILPIPVFKSPLYRAIYEVESGNLAMNEKISLKEDNNIQEFSVQSEKDTFRDNFDLSEDKSTIVVKNKLNDNQIKDENYIVLFVKCVFKIENSEERTEGSAVVIIDLEKPSALETTTDLPSTTNCPTESPCPVCPTTESSTFSTENTTYCPECSCTTDYSTTGTQSTETTPFFNSTSYFTTTSAITESTQYPCTIVTQDPTICPEVTTVPCDCSTTTPDPAAVLTYDQEEYKFDKNDDFTGLVDTIKATSSNPSEDIMYSFDINEPSIKSSITYDPDLKITARIPSGQYILTLYAKGRVTNKQASTKVVLKISTGEICEKFKFRNKLVVKNLQENHDHYNLVSLNEVQKYELQVVDVYPSKFKNNFIVNKINSSLLMTMVDREDDQFKDFWVPQIQVKLRAVSKGPQQKSFRSKREAYQEDLSRPWIISENIENTNNDMILNIVIVDENDNAPIFNQTPSVIGYPNATNVAPPYLVQITATDRDEGENARITYTITNNGFIIDQNNGIITPTKEAFADSSTKVISVTATDHGTPPLSSTIKIKVVLLEDEKITVITVDNLVYSNLKQFFKDLNEKSSETDTVFNYLSASPIIFENQKEMFIEEQTSMRIVAYAIKDEEPVDTTDVKGIIEENLGNEAEVNNIKDSPLSCEPVICQCPECKNCEDCSETGWIVAVVLLSVLLVLTVAAIIVIYVKFIRPFPNLILETRSSIYDNSKKNFKTTEKKNDKKGIPKESLFELDEDKNVIHELHTTPVVEIPETNDLLQAINGKLNHKVDSSEPTVEEEKKVVFNEEVQEIHITVI